MRLYPYLKSNAFYLVYQGSYQERLFTSISRVESCRSVPLGDLLFQAWQTFSVKINILRVLGHLASVSTLVGVQKVHREPGSGRLGLLSDKTGRGKFSLGTVISRLTLCFTSTLNQDSKR